MFRKPDTMKFTEPKTSMPKGVPLPVAAPAPMAAPIAPARPVEAPAVPQLVGETEVKEKTAQASGFDVSAPIVGDDTRTPLAVVDRGVWALPGGYTLSLTESRLVIEKKGLSTEGLATTRAETMGMRAAPGVTFFISVVVATENAGVVEPRPEPKSVEEPVVADKAEEMSGEKENADGLAG